MGNPMSTNIEKKSLEAHVELCAERYDNLDQRLSSLHDRMERVENLVMEIKECLAATPDKSNKMLITIGTTLLGSLIGALAVLIVHLR